MKTRKLSPSKEEELLLDLMQALSLTTTLSDMMLFLQDLLTKAEMEMLSKRLRIAKLLLSGMTYDEIADAILTSPITVAKIAAWLSERGDGFRKIIEQLPKQESSEKFREFSEWDKIKRKYSLYFWPELLLEEIIKSASKTKKEKMKNILHSLKEKNELHRKIEKLLRI